MHLLAFCKKYFWLLSYFFIISFLLVERDVMEVDVNKFIFVAIILVFSIFSRYEQLVSIICFTIPMLNGLPGNYIIPIWLLLILFNEIRLKEKTMKYGIAFCIIIFIMEILHYPLYDFTIDIMKVVEIFTTLFLVVFLIAQQNVKCYSMHLLSFCIGCSVFLLIVVLMILNSPEFLLEGSRYSGDTLREDGQMMLALNANMVGFLSVSSIIIILVLFHYRKVNLLACLIIVAISFIGGVYSISRTWAICLTLAIFLYFFLQKKGRVYSIIVFALIVSVVVYLFASSDSLLMDMFYDRFTQDDLRTAGERTSITSTYNLFLLNNPFELVFGTSALLYKDITHFEHSIHNGTQQILVCYGLIGLSFFLAFTFLALRKYYTRGEVISIIPFIISILYLQTLQSINPGQALYPLMASFLVMKMVKVDKKKKLVVS